MTKYTLGGDPPQSRSEEILMGKKPIPQSRLEELLMNSGGGGSVTPEQIEAAVEAYLEEHPIDVELFEIPVTQSGSTYTTTATAEEILAHADNCVVNMSGTIIYPVAYMVNSSATMIVFEMTDVVNGYMQNVTSLITVQNGTVTIQHYEGRADDLPTVTASDNGKFLRVVNGEWAAAQYAPTIPRVAMASTDTTPTLDPNKLYVFPEMASLTPTFSTPSDSTIANEYHFIFMSGSTATVLTLPATILQPEDFTVEANHMYEISILEGAMTAQGWAVTV